MQDLKITTIQTTLFWEDVHLNLNHFTEKLNEITETIDIIILPEMFTTGFIINPIDRAEEHGGEGLQWMLKKSKEKNCIITGSISTKDKNNYYNRLYWVKPDGSYLYYDKRHLFRMGNEHQHYKSGYKKLIIEYKGWKICPLICYDLRFPVWSRNTKNNIYDIIIYVASWPEIRSYPWKQLLIARAIENQAYTIGVNRIGEDGNNIKYSGDTMIINPRGELINKTLSNEDRVETLSLSYTYLEEYRKLFPVLLDGDDFEIQEKL